MDQNPCLGPHASVFDPKKYALVHFANIREVDPQFTSLSLQGHRVPATRSAEGYQGYWLDPGLEFHHHHEMAVTKAAVSLQALRSLAVIPQMLLRLPAWYQPMLIKTGRVLDQWRIQNDGSRSVEHRTALTTNRNSHESAREGNGATTTDRTCIRCSTNDTATSTWGRERPVWMDTNGGASVEEGRVSHGPPKHFGEGMGNRKAFVQEPWQALPEVTIEDRELALEHHILMKTREKDPSSSTPMVVALKMGGDDTSTVYAAELRAVEMALTLVLESTGPWAKQVKNRHAKEAARDSDGSQNPHKRHIHLAAAVKRQIRSDAKEN
ncbi:zinc knuckle domain protein [Penicillium cinerascens]|uniref:Zinc knuckle domain protein n=1 Tax=Penicillium cinerascens TaxID=70096 RepID=A0A9W9MMC6_9EURO|nr:zinc knuckle domain protein [Penicillium cinerascens]KAJ5203812.1 zinc knuckle domain protein [Penicillium cinerascens]